LAIKEDIDINHFHHSSNGKKPGLLIFNINNIEIGIDHYCIKEIIKLSDANSIIKKSLTSEILSDTERYILINIHGMLELSTASFGNKSRLILIDKFGKKFGFLVDNIVEIINIGELFTDRALEFVIASERNGRITGELKFRKRKIFILNLEKITRNFDNFIEFPRKLKAAEYVSSEMKRRIKTIMGIR
jgi:CheW-like domain